MSVEAPSGGVPAPAADDGAARNRRLVAVRVELGDTLTHIVRRYYGHESAALMTAVRDANPEIADPDVVLAGQTVQIPEPPAAVAAPKADVPRRRADAAPSRRRRRPRAEPTPAESATLYDDLIDDAESANPDREQP
jgi:phage tail protein X